jgi:hypothetical protein
MTDRHKPEDKPVSFRLYDTDLRAWLDSEPGRRRITPAPRNKQARREKRDRGGS